MVAYMSRHFIFGNRKPEQGMEVLYTSDWGSKPGSGTNDDGRLIADMEDIGWIVEYIPHDTVVAGDANGKNGVFISSNCDSALIGNTFKNTTQGICVNEAYIWDDMDMCTGGLSASGGSTMTVENAEHPVTNFDSGNITFGTGGGATCDRTALGPDAYIHGYKQGDSSEIYEFKYDKGDTGANGFVIPGRRIGFGYDFSNGAININTNGRLYCILAMQWAMSIPLTGY